MSNYFGEDGRSAGVIVCAAQEEITVDASPGKVVVRQQNEDGSRDARIDINSEAAVRALVDALQRTFPRWRWQSWPRGGAE